MAQNSELTKRYETYFVLDEGKLRKIVDVLSAHAQRKDYEFEFVFTVKRADDSEYTTTLLETVLNDDNVRRKEIRTLNIVFGDDLKHKYNSKTLCEITFDGRLELSSWNPSAKYTVNDEDERWAFSLTEELDVYMQRTMVKHAREGILKPISSFFDTLIPLLGFLLFIFALNLVYPLKQFHVGDLNLFQVCLLVALISALLILSFDAYNWLKPFQRLSNLTKHNSVFYWGDQKEVYDRSRSLRQNIKWVVFIGFMVSVAAGILVAFILNR